MMRGLFTVVLVLAIGFLLYSVRQLSVQNDQQAATLREQADEIDSLKKELADARGSDSAEQERAAAAQAAQAERQRQIDAERAALEAAKARLAQIRAGVVSDADLARAQRDLRVAKDDLDNVTAELQANRAEQGDLKNQKQNGLVNGTNTKAMTEVEINDEIARRQQIVKDLQAQLAQAKAQVDPGSRAMIKSLQDQLRAENGNIAALQLGRQNYRVQWNADKTAFELDADGKIQQLKADEVVLTQRQASLDAAFRQQQRALNDMKTSRTNRAQAIRNAEQDVDEHTRRLAELQSQAQ